MPEHRKQNGGYNGKKHSKGGYESAGEYRYENKGGKGKKSAAYGNTSYAPGRSAQTPKNRAYGMEAQYMPRNRAYGATAQTPKNRTYGATAQTPKNRAYGMEANYGSRDRRDAPKAPGRAAQMSYAAQVTPKPYGKPAPKSNVKPMPSPRMNGPVRPMPVPVIVGKPAPMPHPREPIDPQQAENILAGRNPIREAVMAGRPIEKLLVARGLTGSALEIIARARAAGIVVQEVDRARLDAVYANHQGMLAYVSAAEYTTLDELLKIPAKLGEDAFFVILDGVTDPHNLGAILRSAACAGAHGAIIPERRAAGLTPAAVKASAGALEHIAVAKVGNLRQTLERLKNEGVWIMAAEADGEDAYKADLTGPIALVIGSEGDGVSPLIRANCDRTLALPMRNGMESLNASVAAGILLYEIRRARGV